MGITWCFVHTNRYRLVSSADHATITYKSSRKRSVRPDVLARTSRCLHKTPVRCRLSSLVSEAMVASLVLLSRSHFPTFLLRSYGFANMAGPGNLNLEIPTTQTAIVFSQHGEPHTVRSDWMVVQPDDLKPGQVLIRLAYTGVCGSDIHAWKGDWPRETKLPLVGGHEGTGRVAAIGKGTMTSLKIGDPVGIKWLAHACLTCKDCRRGLEPACDVQSVHGYTIDGTFQQWCVS